MTSPNPWPGQMPQQQDGSNGDHTTVVTYDRRGLDILLPTMEEEDQAGGGTGSLVGSWWGSSGRLGSRPWHNTPKRRKTVPPNQEIAYERTKAAMQKVASSFFNNAADISIEALRVAADVFEVAPLLGVAEAARVLLSIWQGVQAVETNRLSCLRLTERCATILYSIRSEINTAGTDVADVLQEPMGKLLEVFHRIDYFVHKQVSRPFLKRYLKRDEDAWRIASCDASLTDSVGLFSVAIQLRMLKEVREQNKHLSHPKVPAQLEPHEIVDAIATIRAAQAAHDSAHDVADLYAAMRSALRMKNDVAILELLQIGQGDMQEAIKTLQRALEDPRLNPGRTSRQGTLTEAVIQSPKSAVEPETPSTSSEGSRGIWAQTQKWSAKPPPPSAWDHDQEAAFHREFLESGLDALRRLSGTDGESLPPWTITRWELEQEAKIGIGSFSDVYKGTWRGRQVAIKILAPTTPRKIFRREISIWASLKDTHVLELLGASSATGDPPWFLVSPYMKNGTIVSFLKSVSFGETWRGKQSSIDSSGTVMSGFLDYDRRPRSRPGPLQMMYEIAVGMTYLHEKNVLHGDLKANNVLIDDDFHCVISDFGQSKLRSEVYRLSHRQPIGTLRWQAPEILSGEGVLTPEVDVYAFAIVCVEILTNGELPWSMLDDQAVQQLVLHSDKRPKIPLRPETSLTLVSLIGECWSRDPTLRPGFDAVARKLAYLIGGVSGSRMNPSPQGRVHNLIHQDERHRSPDMAPVDLPDVSNDLGQDTCTAVSDSVPRRDAVRKQVSISASSIPLQLVVTPSSESHEGFIHDEPEELVPLSLGPNTSSLFAATSETTQEGSSEAEGHDIWDGYESPQPRDARIAAVRDERRYRLLLQHNFHENLNLPLWEPSPVGLGAVGYLSKPSGRFVTLFNSLNPKTATDPRVHGLPSIYGYGSVQEASARQERRTMAKLGMDIIQGLLTFKKGSAGDGIFSRSVRKRYSFPLRAGHKHAYLCTDSTTYRYMIDTGSAKDWFKSNVKEIVRLYGKELKVQREDVFLVVGTLEARDYGLFVSHDNPDGQMHFNVFTDRRVGQDWGSFSTDSDVLPTMSGPEFNLDADVPAVATVHATKISRIRATSDPLVHAVLLARLRFKPDEDDPTLS